MTSVYQRIVHYIDSRIKEEITAEGIAEFAGYSAQHVYKLFRAHSPYPLMEYVRRLKLCHAANEMYSGRKIYDIALDYGYETPAGFYKAFKSVFGCSPMQYKKNIGKEGVKMRIDHVRSVEELEAVLGVFKKVHPDIPFHLLDGESEEKFGRKWWIGQYGKNPELLLFAKDGDNICAFTLGFSDDGSCVTVHEGALGEYRNAGIFEALFVEMEKRAGMLGYKGLVLGIGEGEEEFYAKLGYTGKTLVQSEKYTVDELMGFNASYGGYEVTGSGVYDGYVNQMWLNSSLLDKNLKMKYEDEIGDCNVQVIVSKDLKTD